MLIWCNHQIILYMGNVIEIMRMDEEQILYVLTYLVKHYSKNIYMSLPKQKLLKSEPSDLLARIYDTISLYL